MRTFIFTVVVLSALTTVTSGQYHDGFTHRQQLDMEQNFVVFWNPGTDPNTRFTFEIHGRTKGWLGFGMSGNGAMTAADIVLMWFDTKGKPQISDRHGPAQANGFPPEDDHQDYRIISGTRNETHFIFKVERDMDTCDDNDWKISTDTVHLLYAKNDQPPKSKDSFEMHEEKGSQSVRLLSPDASSDAQKQFNAPGVTSWDLNPGNIKVPGDRDTLYWCRVFETKKFAKKMQLIGYDMMIQPGNEKFVHHMLIYGCRDPTVAQFLDKPHECYSGPSQDLFMDYCPDIVGGWAVGSQAFVFPEDKGMKWIGEEYDYIAAEFHYDNSRFVQNITDDSHLRLYITENMRPVKVGRVAIGKDSNNGALVVPPQQTKFTHYSWCKSNCTANFDGGIKIISGLLHSHLAGVAIRFRHFRDGKELPMALYDEHYDFNYQAPQIRFDNPVELLPGDDILLECDYQTMDRNGTLIGGLSTHQEMCLGWLDYYPAQDILIQTCRSTTAWGVFAETLGATAFYRHTDADATVTLPNGKNMSYQTFLDDFDWTQENGKYVTELQKAAKLGHNVAQCAVGPMEGWWEREFDPLDVPAHQPDKDEYCESKLAARFLSTLTVLLIFLCG